MNTHESYVSFETAKLLKQAGFDWEINTYYDDFILDITIPCRNYNSIGDVFVSAPSLAVAQRWLREVKGYDIIIGIFDFPTTEYYAVIYKNSFEYTFDHNSSKSYEKLLEAGIKECLTILLEEKK